MTHTPITLTQWLVDKTSSAPDWSPLRDALVSLERNDVTALAPQPGTVLFEGTPCWQLRIDKPLDPATELAMAKITEALRKAGLSVERSSTPLRAEADTSDPLAGLIQTYRQLDEAGRFSGDILRDAAMGPIPGQVVYRLVYAEGAWSGAEEPAEDVEERRARQEKALPEGEALADYSVAWDEAAQDTAARLAALDLRSSQ